MLFTADVTDYTGHIFKKTGVHVLNTDRVTRYKDKDGSSTNVLYSELPKDRRSQPMNSVLSLTEAEIAAEMDKTPNSNVMMLSIFPNNDITKTPVDKYIKLSDFIHAHEYSKNAAYSVVTMIEGFHVVKVFVVSQSISDIMSSVGASIIEIGLSQSSTLYTYLRGQNTVTIDFGVGSPASIPLSSTELQVTSWASGTVKIIGAENVTSLRTHFNNSYINSVVIPKEAVNMEIIDIDRNPNVTSFTTHKEWTKLKTLEIWDAGITSIDTYAEWVSLEKLNFSFSASLASLTTYATWTNMKNINISWTSISSIELHEEWTSMDYLKVNNTNITSLSVPQEWTSIRTIYAYQTGITSFTTYADWTALHTLWLGDSGITSLVTYAEWVDLTDLNVGSSNLASINTHSTWVNLYNLYIDDANLTSLQTHATWTNLKNFSVRQNSGLTSLVTHPEWTNLGALYADRCALTTFTIHQEWTGFNRLFLYNNFITSATDINNLLIEADAIGMVGFAEVLLYGGTNAAPTGAGITAKNNLIARGVTVTTN